MGATLFSSDNLGANSVQRNDIDTTTTGQALITKAIAGTNVTLSSTGVNPGTGDVTINVPTCVRQILASNTQLPNTANTVENTVYTATIPANSIGVNGSLWFHVLWSSVNSTNGKTLRIKFNGTQIWNMQVTQSLSASAFFRITNRNSLSVQITGPQVNSGTSYSFTNSAVAIQTFAINTGADITLTVTLQNNVAADTCALEAIQVFSV